MVGVALRCTFFDCLQSSALTLPRVICPLALVEQWASEIAKMTNLRCLKHHGPDRTNDPAFLRKYHVVVTTYDTVKSEYAAHNPAASKAKNESKATSKKKSTKDSEEQSEDEKPKKKGKATVKKCAIFGVKWWRVVLGGFLSLTT